MSVEMWFGIIVIVVLIILGSRLLNQRNAGDYADQVNTELAGIYNSERAAGSRRHGIRDISYKGIGLGSTVTDLLAALPDPADVEDRTIDKKDGSYTKGVKWFNVVHPESPLDYVFFGLLDDHVYHISMRYYYAPGHLFDVGGPSGVVDALDAKYGEHDQSNFSDGSALWSWGDPGSNVILLVQLLAGCLEVTVQDGRKDLAVMKRPTIAGRPASPKQPRNLGF